MLIIDILGHNKPLILSPLASITIPPFRSLYAELGADITVSEMTYARGIVEENSKSITRIQRSLNEKCYGIQLLTDDEDDLTKTIDYIERNKLCDFIELNLGCPKSKITNIGMGSALLKPENKKKLESLMIIGGFSSQLPFSLKIRAGYDTRNFVSVLKLADRHNIAFVTFHARLATENYSSPAQQKLWKEAKQKTSLPIIANGDIQNQSQIASLYNQFDVDGVAIGRFARGNPQIFLKDIEVQTDKIYDRLIEYMKESSYYTLSNVKIHSLDFLKRFHYAAKARQKIMKMKDLDKIVNETKMQLKKHYPTSINSNK